MGRKVYWIVMSFLVLLGFGFLLSLSQDPYPRTLIKLTRFENPNQVAESLKQAVQRDLANASVVFIGIEPERPEQVEVFKELLPQLRGQNPNNWTLLMDQSLEIGEFPEIPRIPTKDDFEGLTHGLQQILQGGSRVMVIAPTVYSVQMIEANLISNFKQRTGLTVLSVSLTDFPRKREQETAMKQKCRVEGVDQTGVGPFGCVIAQSSRSHYAKAFPSGSLLGVLNEVGSKDYLLLITREK
jgi:hypothetical protein